MAMHMLKGEFPLIQWGFPYMATGESLFAVPFFMLFGPTPFSLNLSVAVQSLFFIVAIYFLGKRMFSIPVGLLAALYCSIGPVYLVGHCVLARGAYLETLLLGTLALIMMFRILQPKNEKESGPLSYFFLGLSLGLALWHHFLVLFYAIPIAFLFALRPKKLLTGKFFWIVSGFVLGSLPFWIYNFSHQFESMLFLAQHNRIRQNFVQRLYKIFVTDLPVVLGAVRSHDRTPFFPGSHVIPLLYALCFAGVAAKAAADVRKGATRLESLFLTAGVIAYLIVLHQTQFVERNVQRYYVPAYVYVSLIWACGVRQIFRRSKSAAYAIVAVLVGYNLYTNVAEAIVFDKTQLAAYRRSNREDGALIEQLKHRGLLNIMYDEYWQGFRLNFISREQVTFSQMQYERYAPYARAVESADHPAILSGSATHIAVALKTPGGQCDRFKAGPYYVYHNFKEPRRKYRRIHSSAITADASHAAAQMVRTLDHDANSFWTSGRPKTPGMWIQYDLGSIIPLGMIRLWNRGEHHPNYATDIRIEVSVDGRDWLPAISRNKGDLYYWSGPRPYYWEFGYRWEARINAIRARFVRITQFEDHVIHPWMINEAFFYEDAGEGPSSFEKIPELMEAVHRLGLNRVYADRWINAKIRERHGERIKVIEPFTNAVRPWLAPSRIIEWTPRTGFILDEADAGAFLSSLQEEDIFLESMNFGKWVLCYFPERFRDRAVRLSRDTGHDWIGFGALSASAKLKSACISAHARRTELEGSMEEARKHYESALAVYDQNHQARRRLIRLLRQSGLEGRADEHAALLKFYTQPSNASPIQFAKGADFLGYALETDVMKPGAAIRVSYFWKLRERVTDGTGVFVHFRGRHASFQGDYRMPVDHSGTKFPGLHYDVFRHEQILHIPPDLPKGQYEIHLGVFDIHTGMRWKVRKTPFSHHRGSVLVGYLTVS